MENKIGLPESRVRCTSNAIWVQAWSPFPYKFPRTAPLTVNREYKVVVEEEPDRISVTNDKGDVVSYPASMFEVINIGGKECG
jgi:hypothetical protein